MSETSLIILSGGMDSGVLLAETVAQGGPVYALSFDYSAKHNQRELAMAQALCRKYGVEQQIVKLEFLPKLLRSALLQSEIEIPEGRYNEVNMASTVVPFRNGIMLAIAVGVAEDRSIESVLIGSHAGDRAVYPDCRIEFTEAFSKAAQLGTYNGVKVLSPFNHLDKSQIAAIGRKLEFDFRLTWTCYNGGIKHCGRCASCNARKEALKGDDPTEYE